MDFKESLSDIDRLIKSGQGILAKQVLGQISIGALPREFRRDFANAARRLNFPMLGLKILRPVVKPEQLNVKPATAEEWAMYAACLIKIGAFHEVEEIIKPLEATGHPEVLLYSSFSSLSQWNYRRAAILQKKYLKSEELTPYQRAIGQINLSASLLATGNLGEAEETLLKLLEAVKENSWKLFEGNCYELLAQCSIWNHQWARAQDFLNQSSRLLQEAGNFSALFPKKWAAIMDLLRSGPTESVLENLLLVRKSAGKLGDWESVRDCDFHRALSLRDDKLYQHVYFGTVYGRYRQWMYERYQPENKSPSRYVWDCSGTEGQRVFDLSLGKEVVGNQSIVLRPGDVPHRLLLTLTRDFYRPETIGSLFSALYPGEHFNPYSSPGRLYFAIDRLRKFLKNSEIPLRIDIDNGNIKLNSAGPYSFFVPLTRPRFEEKEQGTNQILLSRLTDFGWELVTRKEVEQNLGVSESSALRFLKWATDQGKLAKQGSGRATRYKVA